MSNRFKRGILRPIKDGEGRGEIRYAVTDIEASEWINFLCIGHYDKYTDSLKVFESIREYLDFIFRHCPENDISSVFAHFGGKYDFNFIMKDCFLSERYQVVSAIPRGSSILTFTIYDNVSCEEIMFWDSSALLSFSLRNLTKTFKVESQKGEIDYLNLQHSFKNKNYTKEILEQPELFEVYRNGRKVKRFNKEWKKKEITYRIFNEDGEYLDDVIHPIENKKMIIDYLVSDLKGLSQCLEKFYEWDLVKKAGPSYTIAGQSVRIWQTFLDKPIHSIPNSVDEFVREAYAGGRTEVFKPIFDATYDLENNPDNLSKDILKKLKKQKKIGKLFYLDVNSLYPTVMRDNEFGNKYVTTTYSKSLYNPKGIGFWEVTVNVPKELFCPPLGVNHTFEDGTVKYIFPTGTFKGKWTIAELEYAKTLGIKILKYHKGVIFQKQGYIFRDFINTLYERRLEAKRTGDSVNNTLTKLVMNSTYGKVGMRLEKENLVTDTKEVGLGLHSEFSIEGKDVRFMTKKIKLESFTNVQVSAYVTAYSRILMHKIYMQCGEDHLYYTDTDSIFSSKPFPTGEELGLLKLEYTCTSACFLLPKTYVNEGVEGESFKKKLTMKGFDKKKIKNFTYQDFISCLRGDMEVLKVFQAPKFATLKTALRKGDFLAMNFDPKSDKAFDIKKLETADRGIKFLSDKKVSIDDKLRFIHFDYDVIVEHDPERALELVGNYEEEVKSKLRKLKSQRTRLNKKLGSEYKKSQRSIKSRYDKRTVTPDGFDSTPIHIE